MVALRSRGNWKWEGLSGLHWVWCIGRGPHLQLRQEAQGSSDLDSNRRVPADWGQESEASSFSSCRDKCSTMPAPRESPNTLVVVRRRSLGKSAEE